MLARERTAAVCIVRVEPQPVGVLITLIVNRNIAAATVDPPCHFSEVTAATSAVAKVLHAMAEE